MALRKEMIINGTRYLHTETARYNLGDDTLTMTATIKVVDVQAKKPKSFITVDISDGTKGHQERYEFEPDLTDGAANHIKQAYEYLKTLDAYADAEDI
jgi:hypothetical protein